MQENEQFLFLIQRLDSVTSHFISRHIGLIQNSFRCEIGFSPNISNISKTTYAITIKFSG